MLPERNSEVLLQLQDPLKVQELGTQAKNREEWSDDLICGMEVDTSGEGGKNSREGVDTFGKRSEREEREKEGRN
jgi:hypothetical protein